MGQTLNIKVLGLRRRRIYWRSVCKWNEKWGNTLKISLDGIYLIYTMIFYTGFKLVFLNSTNPQKEILLIL